MRFGALLMVALCVFFVGLAQPAEAQTCPRDMSCTDSRYEQATSQACNDNHMCWNDCDMDCMVDPENCEYSTCTQDCQSNYSNEDAAAWALYCFNWW